MHPPDLKWYYRDPVRKKVIVFTGAVAATATALSGRSFKGIKFSENGAKLVLAVCFLVLFLLGLRPRHFAPIFQRVEYPEVKLDLQIVEPSDDPKAEEKAASAATVARTPLSPSYQDVIEFGESLQSKPAPAPALVPAQPSAVAEVKPALAPVPAQPSVVAEV